MDKQYVKPEFQVINLDEANAMFYAASGPSFTATKASSYVGGGDAW